MNRTNHISRVLATLFGVAMVATVAAGQASADQSRAKPHVVTSSTVDVFVENMYASATTVPVGGETTINVVLNTDITYTPDYVEVFDTTNGQYIGECGTGTVCPLGVIQSTAGTHQYIGYVSDGLSVTNPPSNLVWTNTAKPFVTWSSAGYQVSLTGPATVYQPGPVALTATASADITYTPYYIEVFNEVTGAFVGECGTGSTCPVTDNSPGFSENEYVAFLSNYSRSLPPTGSVAASNLVRHDNHSIP